MSAEDLFGALIPVTYLFFWAVESRWPARHYPPRRGWAWVGIVFLLIIGASGAIVPSLLPQEWLAQHRLFDGTQLGTVGGILVGWPVLSFVAYLWHRNVHRFPLLWRSFHQIHHSPQRVDIPGSVLFHPTEITVFAVMGVAVSVFVLGLNPTAAAALGYIQAFHGMFQHWNVRTPAWLGYLIQRPESHTVHHQKDVHGYNYSDFPLWDILMGTFRNPATISVPVGFELGPSQAMGKMLALKDVSTPGGGYSDTVK